MTCSSLRVTQRGLPPGLAVEIGVINAPTGVKLADVDATAGATGSLDVRVEVALQGVRQVVVEVERRSDATEYGEVGADLPQPCSAAPAMPLRPAPLPVASASTGRPPTASSPAALQPAPPSGAALTPAPEGGAARGTDTRRVTSWVLASAAGLVVLVGAGLLARRRRI